MPRIIATADIHGTLPEIPDCDILIIAGDVCPDFISNSYSAGFGYAARVHYGQPQQAKWLDTVFRKWLDKLSLRNIEVIAIAGNHDFVFEQKFLIPNNLPWIYLEDSEHITHGLRIWGTPYVPNLPDWAFYASEAVLKARAELIPSNLDILISHGPPKTYGDEVSWAGHVGDEPLLDELDRINAKVIITGHIHEGYGKYLHSYTQTKIYNVSHNDEMYNPINPLVRIKEF